MMRRKRPSRAAMEGSQLSGESGYGQVQARDEIDVGTLDFSQNGHSTRV